MRWSSLRAPAADGAVAEPERRRRRGDQVISWVVIVGVTVAAALVVATLYNALVEDTSEPIVNIISSTT